MNKAAVAMAADSTVTLSAGRQGIKTYDTANKLFELVKGQPVGIMIYANAEMNSVPWETIIKEYRSQRIATQFDTLGAYVDDFFEFLNEPTSFLLSTASEAEAFELDAYEIFLDVFRRIERRFGECFTTTGRPVKVKIRRLVDTATEEVTQVCSSMDDGAWPGLTEDVVNEAYSEQAERLVTELFDSFNLTRKQIGNLRRLALTAARKNFELSSHAGVVIAGFGAREAFPSYRHLAVRGRIAGITRSAVVNDVTIDFDLPGELQTFAQDEMARQWVTGINQNTQREIIDYWSDWAEKCKDEFIELVAKEASGIDPAVVDRLATLQHDMFHGAVEKFMTRMNEHLHSRFLSPLFNSIAMLPKEELALIAESMVNLASLRQRTSVTEMETVGGEIDVSLISRGDGFVWLKRKHYFDLDLNPTWPTLHGGMLPTMRTDSVGGPK